MSDKSSQAASVFNKHAQLYQDRFMDVSAYHQSVDFFCENIKVNDATILEIACGPGNITKYLLQQKPTFQLLGIDLAPNMIELAKENNPTANFLVMDAREIASLNKKFDAVLCGFCLPYLSFEETEKLIQDAFTSLNKNGIIYLSTMEDDYAKSTWKKGSTGDELFMHFYRENDLTTLLCKNNFTVLDVQRVTTQMTNNEMVTDIILIASKNISE